MIFDECENYAILMNNVTAELPDDFKSCGEMLLNDIWRYHLKRNVWVPIKIDTSQSLYSTAPSPRYGAAGMILLM